MRLGLIRYVGRKSAPFQVKRGTAMRIWMASRAHPEDPAQQQRWLPEEEARSYEKLPEFVLIRWGQNVPRPGKRIPKPAAVPLSVLLQAKQAIARTVAEMKREDQVESLYLMSTSGTVHVRGCTYEPTKPIGEFYSLDEAAGDPKFKKWHSCIEEV